jgi:rhomboid family GlyGly-CTERM serine protease
MNFDALRRVRFPLRGTALRPRHAGALLALAGLFASLVALDAAGVPVRALLSYARAPLAAGEWWRLLSAHLVHHDARHAALNFAGLALLWVLYVRDAAPREWLVVALGAALAIDAGLYFFNAAVEWYLGASGVLHGVWAAGAVFAARRWRLEGAVTLALLAAKLYLEQRYGALSARAGDLPVITAAHLYGAVGGLASAILLRRARAPL